MNLTGNRLLVQIVGLVDRSRQFSPSQKPANLTIRAPAWLLLEPFAHVGLCAYDEVVRMATEAPEANTKEGRDTLNALKEGQGMALGVRMIWPGEDDLRTVPVRFIGGKGPQPMRPAPVDSP